MHSSARWRDCTSFLSLPYRHWWQSWPSRTLPIKHKTNSLITAIPPECECFSNLHTKWGGVNDIVFSWIHRSHVVVVKLNRSDRSPLKAAVTLLTQNSPQEFLTIQYSVPSSVTSQPATEMMWFGIDRMWNSAKTPPSYASRPLVAIIAQLQQRDKETVLTALQSSLVLTKSSLSNIAWI